MKKIMLMMFAIVVLSGCKDRVIWDDKGKVKEATEDREVWDSGGKIDTGDREIWKDQQGEPVVE